MAEDRISAERERLFGSRITASTANSYRQAYDTFLRYCEQQQYSLSPASHYDRALSFYLAHLSVEGESRSRADSTYYGVIFYRPDLKYDLPYSYGVLAGWTKTTPPQSHPPLTWPITVLISMTLASNGFKSEALATLVAFDGFLRISEFINLRLGDVTLPSDPRQEQIQQPTLLIRHAKTGDSQTAKIYNEDVAYLLHIHVTRLRSTSPPSPPDTMLFGIETSDAYRQCFRAAIEALSLSEHRFVPHSLRHGGATLAFQSGISIETIMTRGRWAALSSASLYIQQATAVRLTSAVPQALHDYAQEILLDLRGNMSFILFQ